MDYWTRLFVFVVVQADYERRGDVHPLQLRQLAQKRSQMVPRTSRRVPKETLYIIKNVELLKLKCFQNIEIKTNFVSFF